MQEDNCHSPITDDHPDHRYSKIALCDNKRAVAAVDASVATVNDGIADGPTTHPTVGDRDARAKEEFVTTCHVAASRYEDVFMKWNGNGVDSQIPECRLVVAALCKWADSALPTQSDLCVSPAALDMSSLWHPSQMPMGMSLEAPVAGGGMIEDLYNFLESQQVSVKRVCEIVSLFEYRPHCPDVGRMSLMAQFIAHIIDSASGRPVFNIGRAAHLDGQYRYSDGDPNDDDDE